MPKLLDRLRAAWLALRGRDTSQAEAAASSLEGYLVDPTQDRARRWAEPLERSALCAELQLLYDEHPLVSAALTRYATGAATGLSVDVARVGSAALLADRVVRRTLANTQLQRYLPAYAYTLAAFGDTFIQIVIDESSEVIDAVEMPGASMVRLSDLQDQLPLDGPAFAQRSAAGTEIAQFAAGQIVHARHRHRRGDRYGRPALLSARGAIRDSLAAIRSLLPRRLANQPFRHFDILGPDGQGVPEPVFEKIKRKLSRVFHLQRGGKISPFDDLFTTGARVDVLGGDGQVDALGDVELLLDLALAPLGVSRQLLGFGVTVNRDILDEQRAEFYALQRQFQQELELQIVRPLLDTALALAGIAPASVQYTCRWRDRYTELHMEHRLTIALEAARAGLIDPAEFRAIAAEFLDLTTPTTITERTERNARHHQISTR